ncbi:Protein EXECUTER 2, chloroplastic [Porphyridium purpureum]|uniref:Protein EXECUTER 2, chloroplastic n=1 Tax=Porphyridium purpureum TaxID=35688 RepID=A0A5J4YN70_PORPP|nr:Protein EXECUTER 2, chloroplastic [Porphyridium purpureum]|eukprot:POR9694..scf295_9
MGSLAGFVVGGHVGCGGAWRQRCAVSETRRRVPRALVNEYVARRRRSGAAALSMRLNAVNHSFSYDQNHNDAAGGKPDAAEKTAAAAAAAAASADTEQDMAAMTARAVEESAHLSLAERVSAQLTVDTDALRELRVRWRIVRAQLERALDDERYLDAAAARDRLAEIRLKDPLMRYEDLSAQLQAALKVEDYKSASRLRDEIREVQARLPHFRLRGKWGGVYGASGVQTVEIDVQGNELVACKITGDSNVPAGQLTFKVDVSMDGIIELGPGDKPDPIAVALNQFANLKVKQRFRGQGQIANPGFVRPQWVPGELIVFEDDIIAFVWKPLSFMVVFERASSFE